MGYTQGGRDVRTTTQIAENSTKTAATQEKNIQNYFIYRDIINVEFSNQFCAVGEGGGSNECRGGTYGS